MPKQVHKTVFVTRDGEEFASNEDAVAHERLLDFQDHYEKFDKALFGFDARRLPVEDVMDWLRENREAVLAFYGKQGCR